MNQLITIFADSFVIWARNFSLMYVILLGLLLQNIFTPQNVTPTLETRWILLLVTLMLLMAAFMAGWFNMIAMACRRYTERDSSSKKDTATDLMDNFTLLKAFLPGISLHILSVTGSFLIVGGLIFAFSWLIQPLWQAAAPVIQPLIESAPIDQAKILGLPIAQQLVIQKFSLAALGAFLFFSFFIMFTSLWPAFVTLYGDNVFKAYAQSILKFFKDPFRFVLITGFYIGSQVGFLVLTAFLAASNTILGIVSQLAGLMFSIYMLIVLFMYTLRTTDRVLLVEDAPEPEESKDSEDSDNNDEPPLL